MVTQSTTHHRCMANGIKFHYAEAGEGPPVVLLHGFPETSYAWRYQIEALKTRYRLIVPDPRGYGATDRAPTGYDKRTINPSRGRMSALMRIPDSSRTSHKSEKCQLCCKSPKMPCG